MDTPSVCVLIIVVVGATNASIVNTTVGMIQGTELSEAGIETFLGIPYAEAPVGNLRFTPPVRKSRMEGVYNAVSNNRVCPQLQANTPFSARNTIQTEDCLRLDIYKPLAASGTNPLPVMIWVHGGGFQFGDSKGYNGIQISIRYDVIFVAVNYRLGILGFLNTMDENSIGNFGLRDQCSAIEWVVDNIEAFGGNASSVTILGESAGSASVVQLALSSLCQGKFQRVIAQSGTPGCPWSYNNDPRDLNLDLATQLNCPFESGAFVECLRQKNFSEIVNQQSPNILGLHQTWAPTYSGDVFPENPLDVLKGEGASDALSRFLSLDFMVGLMVEEGGVFIVAEITGGQLIAPNTSVGMLSDKELDERLRRDLKLYVTHDTDAVEKLLPSLKFRYTDWGTRDDVFANIRMAIEHTSDVMFVVDGVHTARRHADVTSSPDTRPTYFYQFKHKPSWSTTYPWTVGATHGEDIPFLFEYTRFLNPTSEENVLSQVMMEYWTNFAKTGNPNSPSQTLIKTTWPPFNTKTEEYIVFDVNMTSDSTTDFPYDRRVAFWEELIPPQLKSIKDFQEKVEDAKCYDKISSAPAVFAGLQGVLAAYIMHFLHWMSPQNGLEVRHVDLVGVKTDQEVTVT